MATVKGSSEMKAGASSVVSILAALYHLPLYLLPPHTGGQRTPLGDGGTIV